MNEVSDWTEYGEDGFCLSLKYGMTESLNRYREQKLGTSGHTVFSAKWRDGRHNYILVDNGYVVKESPVAEDIASYIDIISLDKNLPKETK